MPERTRFQEKVIKNYYNNRDAIAVQRVQELVTELYLSSGKKREQYWKSLAKHLEALGVKPDQIEKLIADDDVEAVAKLLPKLMK